MGVIKILYYVVISTLILFMVLNNAPNLLDIEPQAYTPSYVKYEGALAINKDLDKAEIILRGATDGPESFVIKDGYIYASLNDGRIVAIMDDKVVKTVADICKGSNGPCRPIGIRSLKNDLYVAVLGKGLLKVDINSGKTTVLLSTSTSVGGKRFSMPNDLDIDEQGIVYISDISTRWNYLTFWYGFFEHENSGRIIKFDTQTGKAEVLVPDLFNPNGVQLSQDKKSLLIAEFTNCRILRHHLQGPKKGQTEVFTDLPGEPDNIRPSLRGGYWLPVVSSRDASSPRLVDRLSNYPKLRKAVAKLGHLLGTALKKVTEYWPSPVLEHISEELHSGAPFWPLDRPILLEINAEGQIIRSWHSQDPELALFSQALEKDGYLYLGSFANPFFAKLKL